jgi:hypothetical protein
MNRETVDYSRALKDRESLGLFLAALAEFDRSFCDSMVAGKDFTLILEAHGNLGELLHVRVKTDGFKRPHKVEQRVERQLRHKNH